MRFTAQTGSTSGRSTPTWLLLAALAALAVGAWGCASDSGATYGCDECGGQTGSLRCGVGSLGTSVAAAPGDGRFIVRLGGCPVGSLDDIRLTDEDGAAVAIAFVELENGAVLVKPAEKVRPGTYTVGGRVSGTVLVRDSDAAEVLGDIAYEDTGGRCGQDFRLELDPKTKPYWDLMSLEVSVDGQPPVAWTARGEVAHAEPLLTLPFELGEALAEGRHKLQVTADFGNNGMGLPPAEVFFEYRCPPEADSACSASRHHRGNGWQPWWMLLALLLLRLRAPPPDVTTADVTAATGRHRPD